MEAVAELIKRPVEKWYQQFASLLDAKDLRASATRFEMAAIELRQDVADQSGPNKMSRCERKKQQLHATQLEEIAEQLRNLSTLPVA